MFFCIASSSSGDEVAIMPAAVDYFPQVMLLTNQVPCLVLSHVET